jgi:hypothetical protein
MQFWARKISYKSVFSKVSKVRCRKMSTKESPSTTTKAPPPPPGLRQPLGPSNPVLEKVVIVSFDGERDEQYRPIGKGVATFKHGHTYEGDFMEGWMHGEGTFTWKDGTVYTGSFVRNTIEGEGRFEWLDGSYYHGGVKGGIRHGKGVMQIGSTKCLIEVPEGFRRPGEEPEYIEITGPYYDGEWENGTRHGTGTLYYKGRDESCKYVGTWKNGQRDGQGELTYPSGNVYVGGWANDQREGAGIMRWKEEVYDGLWHKNKQEGRGTHVWLKGGRAEHGATQRLMCNRYVGDWKNGLRDGNGVFYYSNGSR